jgi:hypothetical protein
MAIEAPFCCMFIDHVQVIAGKVEERPLWNRAAVYCMWVSIVSFLEAQSINFISNFSLALIPVVLCPGLGSIFACGLVFGSGVIYGMMGLGKK